jgi:hypothetical protein
VVFGAVFFGSDNIFVERGGRVSDAMRAFRTFLGQSDMMGLSRHDGSAFGRAASCGVIRLFGICRSSASLLRT